METRPVIAVDFGGVLSVHDSRKAGQAHFKTDIDMPGALDVLRHLSKTHDLVLVSFCGKTRAKETRDAIQAQAPGIFRDLIFVKDKKSKGTICQMLGASYLIDDSEEVLNGCQLPCRPVWFGEHTHPHVNWLTAKTWKELKPLQGQLHSPVSMDVTKLVHQLD